MRDGALKISIPKLVKWLFMEKTRLATIDFLRVVAAMAIVSVHMSAQSYWEISRIGYQNWLVSAVLGWWWMWGTPVFIMISGYLLLNSRSSGWEFYLKRLKRLLIPWLFWNLIYYGWSVNVEAGTASFWDQLWTKGNYYHLYFLNLLIGLYVVTPILKKWFLGKYLGWWVLGWVVGAYVYQIGVAFWGFWKLENIWWWFVPYVGYYLAGYWLGRVRKISGWWLVLAMSVLGVGIFVTSKLVFWWSDHSQNTILVHRLSWLVAGVAMVIFKLVSQMRDDNKLIKMGSKLAPLSMGIYFVHPLVFGVLKKWCLTPEVMVINFWGWYLGLWLGTILLSVGLVWGMKKMPGLRWVV